MAVDKISPNDPRVKKDFREVKGRKWYFWDAAAKGTQKGTVFLVHGFPDLALAWRYQIPMLTELGLRCIAIDCMGYGDTGFSPNLADYSWKNHADAIADIARQLGCSRIIVGGHDWGGAVVWRVAQWYPDLVSHVFSVCTPFFRVTNEFVSLKWLVENGVPQFGYQFQTGSEDHVLEKIVGTDREKMRTFLNGLYGGKVPEGKTFIDSRKGIDLELLKSGEVGMTPLLSEEELDYYVDQYIEQGGIEGPCNWYRTRRINFEEERAMPEANKNTIKQPTLFIFATRDKFLSDPSEKVMARAVPNLTRETVEASHWALWHTPQETNDAIKRWVQGVVFGGKSKL